MSSNVICVFFKTSSQACDILEHHMKILCAQHLEARFMKIDVEKAPFLTGNYYYFIQFLGYTWNVGFE